MENAMIALLIAHANSAGLVTGALDFQIWNQSLNDDGLKGPMSLYAYESVLKGINPNVAPGFIQQSQFFSLLYVKKVSFLSINSGFTSIATTLRRLRGDNNRMRRLRADYLDDFEFDLDEFDEEEDADDYEADDLEY